MTDSSRDQVINKQGQQLTIQSKRPHIETKTCLRTYNKSMEWFYAHGLCLANRPHATRIGLPTGRSR